MTQAVTATGQVAHDAGMSFEQLAAISAKVAERTREDGSSIGNAMKTIITRISKVNKMPQYAEEIDSSTVSKASESLAAVGVQVYKPSGEMNDMITILTQLREKWDGLSDAQQANIAFNIAATRQTSKFKNILMAWTDSMELAQHATESQGGALENQEKYEESIAGKTQKIRTEMDSFWIDLYNSDATKGILDFVINLTEAFNGLSDAIGPLQALLSVTFGGIAAKGVGGGLLGMLKAGTGLKSFSEILSGAHAADIFRNTFGKNAAEWGKYDFGFVQNTMMQRFPAQQELFASATSMEQLAVASIKTQTAVSSLFKTMAIGTGVIAGLIATIYIAKKAYDAQAMSTNALIKRNQALVEEDRNRLQSIKDEKQTYSDNASSLQTLLNQYKEAEYGSEQYYNIRQQIADQYPNLVTAYDSEGRAIVATTEQIQAQIDKYKELSDQQNELLQAEARTNINREIGQSEESIGKQGILGTLLPKWFATQTGNSSYKDLLERRRKIEEQLSTYRKEEARLREKYQTDDLSIVYDDLDYTGINYSKAISNLEAELSDIIPQIIDSASLLRENYTLLAQNIDSENETLVTAAENWMQLALAMGNVSDVDFEKIFNYLQNAKPEALSEANELMDSILNPDLTKIDPKQYSNEMIQRVLNLQDFLKQNGVDLNVDELFSALDIKDKQKEIRDKISSILNGSINGVSNKDIAVKLGIDLEAEVAKYNSDVLGLDAEQLLSDKAKEIFFRDYKDVISQIQAEGATLSKAQKTDWENALPVGDAEKVIDTYQRALTNVRESDFDLTKSLYGNLEPNLKQVSENFQTAKQEFDALLKSDNQYLDATGSKIKEIAQNLVDTHLVSTFDEAIQKMADWGILADDTAKGIKEAFEEVSSEITNSITAFTTGITSYASAISEMQKNGSVTKDTYSALIGANEAYQSALVESSSGMQMHVDRLQDVKDAEEKVIRTKLSDEIANQSKLLQTTLSDLEARKAQLYALGDAEDETKTALQEEVARLMDSRNAIEDNIGSLQRLQGELDAATSKYKQWQDAQSGGDSGDQYDSIFGYKDTFETAYKQHRYGDEGFQKFVQLFTGEGDNNVIAANGKQYYESISKFMKNYFSEGPKGIQSFYKTMQTALSEAGFDWTTPDGGLDIKNYDVLRHVLTDYFQQNGYGENFEVTSELLEIIGKAFREYGYGDGFAEGSYVMDVDAQQQSLDALNADYKELVEEQKKYFKGSDEWNQLQQKIDEVQREIDGTTVALGQAKLASKDLLGEDELSNNLQTLNNSEQVQQVTGGTNVDVPLTFSNADQAEASFQGLVELKRQLLESGEIDINGDEIKAVDELIKHALASKYELIQPAYVDIEVSDVASKLGKSEAEVSNYKQKLDELRTALEDQHIAINTGDTEGFKEATDNIQTLRDELQNLDKTGELAKAFDVDTSTLDTLQTSLMDTGKEAGNTTDAMNKTGQKVDELRGKSVGNFGLPVAEGYATSLNIALGNTYTNLEKLTGKDWTINVKANTPNNSILQGNHQYTGTTGFAKGTWSLSGRAAARGDMGAKKTETALVGELGPEMRVRGSKWELLGQNGAEFADVHKGDIIFNHKQTEQLLKNGHIDSRGKAIAQRVIEDNGAFAYGTSGTAFGPGNKVHIDDSDNSSPGGGGKNPKGKKSTKGSKKNNNNKKDKDTDKLLEDFKKALENIVDWIEVKISRQTDVIDSHIAKAESNLDKATSLLSTSVLSFSKKTDYFDRAAKSYHKSITALFDQIGNETRGAKYYKQFADQQMARARKNGLITKGQEKKYKQLVQNGEIKSKEDIDQLVKGQKDLSGHELKKYEAERLAEAINVYKEWYEKSYEAKKAVAELTEQVREQVKALKEVRDAERDARIERSKTLTQIKTGGYQATNDTDATYSNILLSATNADLNISDQAYAAETSALTSQRDKYGKKAKGAFSAAKKEIKRTSKGKTKKKLLKKLKGLTKTYEKKIQKYVKNKQLIPESTILKIQKISPDAAARLIAYNETIGNLETARLEQAAALAENSAARTENINAKYENNEQAFNNAISLYDQTKANATTAADKNTQIGYEISTQTQITQNARDRLKEHKTNRQKLAKDVKSKSKNKEVQKAVEAAKNGQPITNLDVLTDLYTKEKLSWSFLQSCRRYNNALEAERDAQAAKDIAEQTEKKENSARFLEQGQNITDEAEKNKNTTLGYNARVKAGGQYTKNPADDSNAQQRTEAQARISLAEAQGHYASEADYIKQIQMDNRDLQTETQKGAALVDEFNAKVKANPWWVGTAEYHQFLELINDSKNNIDNLTQSTIELAKAIKKLEWQKFDDGMAKVARFNSEIDYFVGLLGNQTLFDEDNKGNITKYGAAAIDLQNTNMLAYAAEAQQYQNELNKLLAEYASQESDLTDKDFDERQEVLTDKIRELTSNAESAKQSMIDYARQAYEAQLSYLNKTIDKYKELKNAEKEAYDYQKQISESTKNITNLEKQLAAFEGNTSEEAVARVQKLRADLKEAKQNQSDQQYEKYLSDSQKMLDDLSNNFQEWIGFYLKDQDRVIQDLQQELAGELTNLGEIDADTVKTLQEFESSLNGGITTLSADLKTELDNNGNTIDKTLNNIYALIEQFIKNQPFQEEASIFEGKVKGYENLEEITLADYDAIKALVQEFADMGEDSRNFVSRKAEKTLNDADSKVSDLRKKEDDRLAKQKADEEAKRQAELAEEAKQQADAVAAAALTKQTVGFASTDSKKNTTQTQADKAKEQALLDQIEDIRNQMRVNRDKYRVAKNEPQKADLDKQYNDLQVKLNKLYTKLAKLTKASTTSKNSTVYQALNPLASAFAPSTAKGTAKTYASGSSYIKKDQLAYTQDKGQEVIYRKSDGAMLTPLGKGDKVFTNAMSENLWKLAQMNIPAMINSAMSQPIVQNMNQNVNQSMGDVQFVINLYGVENYDKFKSQLVADTQFQNALQEMTLGAAMGRNSLSKFKYN